MPGAAQDLEAGAAAYQHAFFVDLGVFDQIFGQEHAALLVATALMGVAEEVEPEHLRLGAADFRLKDFFSQDLLQGRGIKGDAALRMGEGQIEIAFTSFVSFHPPFRGNSQTITRVQIVVVRSRVKLRCGTRVGFEHLPKAPFLDIF